MRAVAAPGLRKTTCRAPVRSIAALQKFKTIIQKGGTAMATAGTVDIQEFINSRPLSRYQIMVIVLCFFVVAADGFDTAAVGYIAPALRAQWGVTPAQLAPLFGAGLFGLMTGAFIFGPLADKVGRKAILVFTTAAFGVACLLSATATSIESLTIWRFVTGIGLGGAMPSAITVTAEFSPACILTRMEDLEQLFLLEH